jgi:hypothetical protein
MSRYHRHIKLLCFIFLLAPASCNGLQGDYISKEQGLGVEVVSQSLNKLELRLWTADGYGDGFAAVVGSPYTKQVKLHKSLLDGKCRSATIKVTLTGQEFGVFLETLRGSPGDSSSEKSEPQWWTNLVKVYVNPGTSRVVDVEFLGDLQPSPLP